MKSSPSGIPDARKQMKRILSVYIWAFRTLAATHHAKYNYQLEGTVFIPKFTQRNDDKNPDTLENGIFNYIEYL